MPDNTIEIKPAGLQQGFAQAITTKSNYDGISIHADNTITLKDVLEKLVKIEASISAISTYLSDLTSENTIENETNVPNPFMNPATGLYDIKYYRSQQMDSEKED